MAKATGIFFSSDLISRRLVCDPVDVVFVKSIVNAYDGLCCLFSDNGHDVQLVAPRGREAELDQLVSDLEIELNLQNAANCVVAKP